ncbi:MAG TPA: YajG family lipoprotein, partial [Methylomirabilota bacterium]|nr:YajG family lipoprotein [Methylomirabilota bacterium]
EAGVNRAMLATVAPRRIVLAPVTDRRADRARIGTAPGTAKDLVTERPVTDVVRDALALELAHNGHVVAGDGPDVALAASVEEFWLDTVAGHSTTQYVGKVVLALTVSDARGGSPLVTRRYVGVKRRVDETPEASRDAERQVMNAALARTMHDVATDPELVRALAAVRVTGAPARP